MDRHNMLVFLMNDTRGEKPAGYEADPMNIFDPADDANDSCADTADPAEKALVDEKPKAETKTHALGGRDMCRRPNCNKTARFDSSFCSDACGVALLESDLLRNFNYCSDLHPSQLRH